MSIPTEDKTVPSILDAMDLTTTDPPPEFSLDPEPPPLWIKPGGTVCVGGTRVGYNLVVNQYNQGRTPEQIAEDYEVLKLADVYGAIAFYLRHREAVDRYLERYQEMCDAIQAEWEATHPRKITREVLMQRLEEKRKADAAAGK